MSQLRMHRANLDGLDQPPSSPAGYIVRMADMADAAEVAKVLAVSFDDPNWTPEKVMAELLENDHVDSCWVVTGPDGQVVATASAQMKDDPLVGWVHWVGADPSHSGKGLGYIASWFVLRRHVELGKQQALLTTDDHRLPAIRTYLKLGFEPHYLDETHPARWAAILEKLG